MIIRFCKLLFPKQRKLISKLRNEQIFKNAPGTSLSVISESPFGCFFTDYELAASTESLEDHHRNFENKCCRFCGRTHPEVSFKTKPHLLPDLFGRNKYLSNSECDSCNASFKSYETDMANFIAPYMSLYGIQTKRGIPVFQSRKAPYQEATTLRVKGAERQMYFGSNLSDFAYDKEKKAFSFTLKTKKFSPYALYKVLLKIGISLMPENEFKANIHYLQFLNSENPIINGMQHWNLYRFVRPGMMVQEPSALLYRAKQVIAYEMELPEYCLVIKFANMIFQMFLPVSRNNFEQHDERREELLWWFPGFVGQPYETINQSKVEILDLSQLEKGGLDEAMTVYYDKLIEGNKISNEV